MSGRVALFLLLCALVLGCGSSRRPAAMLGIVEPADPQSMHGREVFDTFCHQCHPGGTAGLGPAINNKSLPGFLIKFQVRNGLGMMPAFSEEVISGEELDDLVEYLMWLRSQSGDD